MLSKLKSININKYQFKCNNIRRLSSIITTNEDSNFINGFATVNGTENFIALSKINIHYQFRKTKLFINPIIHGPPINPSANDKKDVYNSILTRSIVKNRCNGIYVYNYKDDYEWHSDAISDIITTYPDITREQLVTFANVGKVMNPNTIEIRLNQAKKLCKLSHIDILIVELSYSTILHDSLLIIKILDKLESLSKNKLIQSFGLQFDIPPFNCHNPPLFKKSNVMLFPTLLEEKIYNKYPHAEIIMSSISPSNAVPITHPAIPDDDIEFEGSEEIINSHFDSYYTHVATNPFKCYRGLGPNINYEEDADNINNELLQEAYSDMMQNDDSNSSNKNYGVPCNDESYHVLLISNTNNNKELDDKLALRLDNLCPELKSTPLLQDKALRVLFSISVDAVVVESELTLKLNKLSLKPEDLLLSHDTDDVFGFFQIPKKQ